MTLPEGFSFAERKNGEVVITHLHRVATVLRGRRAQAFLGDIASGADSQQLMARITGNYRRGNERTARAIPRHRS